MVLEFGKPQNPSQALIRLPDKSHPGYDEERKGPYGRVAHFREFMFDVLSKISDGIDIPLEERWFPLKVEEMKLLIDSYSFKRKPEPMLITNWRTIDKESVWGKEYFSTGEDGYRWWRIHEMEPSLDTQGFELICVETNHSYSKKTIFNENSRFDIFVLKPEELQSLVNELS